MLPSPLSIDGLLVSDGLFILESAINQKRIGFENIGDVVREAKLWQRKRSRILTIVTVLQFKERWYQH